MDDISFELALMPLMTEESAITAYDAPRCNDGTSIEELIASFVKAKFALTQSQKTAKAYFTTTVAFRRFLLTHGVDLLTNLKGRSVDEVDMFRVKLADCARDFVIVSAHPGKLVSKTTRNQRLAILSSFYQYAEQNKKISFANPITLIQRSKVEPYGKSVALEPSEVSAKLEALASQPEKTIEDKRNLALLAMLFTTGRRVHEIQSLQLNDLRIVPLRVKHETSGKEVDTEYIVITFQKMKSGKSLVLTLDMDVSAYVLDYIRSYYGAELYTLTNAPVWVNLSPVPMTTKQQQAWERMGCPEHRPLGYQAIRQICDDFMDFRKVHITRHTFTKALKRAGATLEERQALLGHSSPVTTQLYDRQDDRGSTKYTASVAEMFGLKNNHQQ
jgi:integrase